MTNKKETIKQTGGDKQKWGKQTYKWANPLTRRLLRR